MTITDENANISNKPNSPVSAASILRPRNNLNSPIIARNINKRKQTDDSANLPPAKVLRGISSNNIGSTITTPLGDTPKLTNATLGISDFAQSTGKEYKNENKENSESVVEDKTEEKATKEKSQKKEDEQEIESKDDTKTKEEIEIDKKAKLELEKEEMKNLMDALPYLREYYELEEKIGRGTFSTVYKALDIRREMYKNDDWLPTMLIKPYTGQDKAEHMNSIKTLNEFVALKRIYSTSSPQRIVNEIRTLQELKGAECVSPIVTAFRDGEETFIVMPYIQHDEFKDIFNVMGLHDIKCYIKSLFTALSHLHELKIVHKDVKPNNFLYNVKKKVGFLIDFGLAQREDETKQYEESQVMSDLSKIELVKGYDTNDTRKRIKANRAGTRGYRAPEVLLRVIHQTTAVDIWSAGTIFLSILTGVFPFFIGYDEADSLVEIASVFGLNDLQKVALKYTACISKEVVCLL
ncbi:hypothetical protein RMCBS344292_18990 [Rhizopus microsporus]|nr:hypothetical protein RMCBS344292_18990 [Rhizopus microsporus]